MTFIPGLVINRATVDIIQIPVLYTVQLFRPSGSGSSPLLLLNNLYLFTELSSTQIQRKLSL